MKVSLKAARVNAGLTGEQASKALGISRTTLGNWERGITSPSVDDAEKLSNLYSCSTSDIIFLHHT